MLVINMKRRISILIVAFVLFAIPAWAIYQSSTFGNRSGIAAGGGGGIARSGSAIVPSQVVGSNPEFTDVLTVTSGEMVVVFAQTQGGDPSALSDGTNTYNLGLNVATGWNIYYYKYSTSNTYSLTFTVAYGNNNIIIQKYTGCAGTIGTTAGPTDNGYTETSPEPWTTGAWATNYASGSMLVVMTEMSYTDDAGTSNVWDAPYSESSNNANYVYFDFGDWLATSSGTTAAEGDVTFTMTACKVLAGGIELEAE